MKPTPYPDVNAVLHAFRRDVEAILGSRCVGIYLFGSLALGDFSPERTSDIDFLVVTADAIPQPMLDALAAMHAGMLASGLAWATELEGAYIPLAPLRRYRPDDARHPMVERHERLEVKQHDSDWVIHRHVLRERGVTVAGPPPDTLIDPITPDELRQAAVDCLRGWWAPMLDDPTRLHDPWYQAYAVLTMCRILETLEQGTVTSKPAAARWARQALGDRWATLIERALTRGRGEPFDHLEETMDFIRYARDRSHGVRLARFSGAGTDGH